MWAYKLSCRYYFVQIHILRTTCLKKSAINVSGWFNAHFQQYLPPSQFINYMRRKHFVFSKIIFRLDRDLYKMRVSRYYDACYDLMLTV